MTEAPAPAVERVTGAFFARDVAVVAEHLLGAVLCTTSDDGVSGGRIIEVEAYRRTDSCCHSFRGRTPRNAAMFAAPGTVYVYLVYGMHHCVNFACDREGQGDAVLVRALAPMNGVALMRARRGPTAAPDRLCGGPGNLCRALGIDRGIDGADVATSPRIALYEGARGADETVVRSARIGVVGAPGDVALPWRWRLVPAASRRPVR